ncbi:hypothetical protein [Nocardia sp. NPDC059229]|uniref:hypothetical protein n=1 Tax=Nocardia sp. NPDC059229 TaxID=3346778 RepID=UPI003682A23B
MPRSKSSLEYPLETAPEGAALVTVGKASAFHRRFDDGEQVVIVHFGNDVHVHVPHCEDIALQADLNEALAEFVSGDGAAVAS